MNSIQHAQRGENKPLPHTYSNLQDNFVIHTLGTAPIMTLPIDRFGHLISQNGELPNDERIVALRHALISNLYRGRDGPAKCEGHKRTDCFSELSGGTFDQIAQLSG